MGRAAARMEESRSACKILTGKPTGKRSLWRPRRRWEYNITILEWTLMRSVSMRVIRLIQLGIGIIGEPLGAIHKLRHTIRGEGVEEV